jgi:hypothetical protein
VLNVVPWADGFTLERIRRGRKKKESKKIANEEVGRRGKQEMTNEKSSEMGKSEKREKELQ